MRLTLVFLITGLFFISFAHAAVDTSQCDASLRAYLQFEDDLSDAFGNLRPSSPSTSGTYEDAMVDRGIRFDGINSQEDYTDHSTPLIGSSGFTIEFWFEEQSFSSGRIFEHQGFVGINWDQGTLHVYLVPSSYLQSAAGHHEYSISNPGDPHHYAVVFTDSSDTLELYVDGTLQTPTVTTVPSATIDLASYTPLLATVGDSTLDGTIDELAIFNEPLSESGSDTHNIDSHYAASFGGDNYCESSSADFSSITSEFTVDGCSGVDPINGETIHLTRGACSRSGKYFCPLVGDAELKDTISTDPEHASAKGCDFGDQNGDNDYNPGDPMCCPSGYVCNKNGDMTCAPSSLEVCGSQAGPSSCSQAGCFWLNELNSGAGGCVASPSEFGCGIYTDEDSCLQDNYNVGADGVGTEVCDPANDFYDILDLGPPSINEVFVVPQESCGCTWDNTAQSCELSWDFEQALYGTGDTPKSYTCKVSFTFETCTAGEQTISWTARQTDIQGWSVLPQEALDDPGCVDGSLTRSCGEPVIKLPGFGMTNFVLALTLLGLFYAYTRKEE